MGHWSQNRVTKAAILGKLEGKIASPPDETAWSETFFHSPQSKVQYCEYAFEKR